ncbi:MAG TPA: RsmE family RNA methyltransferase [Vicinamibacterales bacterium]|nr:RsmE family RNA methyltransferase [Vicinamibacterales bacterium]
MNLLLLEPDQLSADGAIRLAGPQARHLLTVLRAVQGDEVRVGLLNGPLGRGRVVATADGAVDLRCTFDSGVPEPPRVDLLLALPRPKVLRRLWSQLAALGVGQIVLTNAARVERNYFDTHVLTPACYRPLLIEGLQQARDTRLPSVSIHRQFRVLIEDDLDRLVPDAVRVAAHPGDARTIADVLRDRSDGRVLLAVGPEGGWNDFELDLLRAHRFVTAGLGPRTLRTDTACVALISIVHGVIR